MALNARWAQARNILVVRLDSMGDVLMTSPALTAIRHTAPDARITLLTSASGAEAGRRLSVVDDVLTYVAPWMKPAPGQDAAPPDLAFIARLANRQFDAAIIFTVCTQSALPAALLCQLAGIPLRLAQTRENPYGLLTDWLPDVDTHIATARHEVQRQLDLVGHVGYMTADTRLQLDYGASEVASMRRRLTAAGGDATQPYIVIHPGATAASRRYPAAQYAAAAQRLERSTGWRIVLTGGTDEAALIEQACDGIDQPVRLDGQLDLGELAALIAGAQVLVCNNTGPAHVAAAVGTPVVVLYALTNPQHTPWQVPMRILSHDVGCRYCLKSQCPQRHHDCLVQITPTAVVEAVTELVSSRLNAPTREACTPFSPRDEDHHAHP